MRTGGALIGAVAHAGSSTLLSACIILCESKLGFGGFLLLPRALSLNCCLSLLTSGCAHHGPEQGQRETCVGKPGTIPGALQHEVLQFKARHYIGIYTVLARMDAAATIIFRSGKMRCLFEGG